MAMVIAPVGGGAGAALDPDELTATAADVLFGKIAGVKDNDEPVSGTMPNNGAASKALNAGGSYTIPKGYHNGSGKVTANTLASQTSANAAVGDILTGKTAWVNGSKLTGAMATMAGQTITPSASQQTISCSGKKMTGNIVVSAIPSNVSTSFISAGGRNDASTYPGESTDSSVVFPNGNCAPYKNLSISSIRSAANGLILNGERYCYDFYFSGSSTSRMSKNTANFWARPVLCANIATITAKVHATWSASRKSDRINIYLRLYLCYLNDNSTYMEEIDSNYASSVPFFDRDDTATHTDDFTLTISPNATLKKSYKWVAPCVRFSCHIQNSTPGIRLTLGAGTGITDISYIRD